ncbi:hypothetical protein KSP40_PGU010768 [Platanthera guangdongensis]|uniref:Uncharacterized protein n=1 Tax=Platanthera guangdongensis TaxID=2320717 RepID=A0ABR2M6J5_9ASPA
MGGIRVGRWKAGWRGVGLCLTGKWPGEMDTFRDACSGGVRRGNGEMDGPVGGKEMGPARVGSAWKRVAEELQLLEETARSGCRRRWPDRG